MKMSLSLFIKGVLGSSEDSDNPEGTTRQCISLSLQVCTLKKVSCISVHMYYIYG